MTNGDTKPLFSLIVASCADKNTLHDLLESLVHQQASFEVIIIDQNTDDRVDTALASSKLSRELVHLKKVDFKNASKARNLGVQYATGEWLLFPDDDCTFHEDTLSRITQLIELPQQPNFISGKTLNQSGQPTTLRWAKHRCEIDQSNVFYCVSESTIACRRDLFISVGGFDERFGPGAFYPVAEGLEMMERLFHSGRLNGLFDPDLIFYHENKFPPWDHSAVKAMARYGFGEGALIAKHLKPNMLRWFLITTAANLVNAFSSSKLKRKAFRQRLLQSYKGFLAYRGEAHDG